jgi:hypothetical protein
LIRVPVAISFLYAADAVHPLAIEHDALNAAHVTDIFCWLAFDENQVCKFPGSTLPRRSDAWKKRAFSIVPATMACIGVSP